MLQITEDELINAIRQRLGISTDGDRGRLDQICERFFNSSDARQQEQVTRICRFLAGAMEQAVRCQLNLSTTGIASAEEREFLGSLWNAFRDWVRADELKRSPRLSRLLREAISGKKSPPAAGGPTPDSRRVAAPPAPDSRRVAPAPPSASPGPHPQGADMQAPGDRPDRPRPAGPQWQYHPVPPGDSDPHPESDARALLTPEEDRLLAARVRGKKHKHEGSNCDDWFETAVSGRWTLIAVSDGAGSKKFSRVGARASCQEAVRLLAADLAEHRVPDREAPADLARKDDQHEAFLDPEVEFVQGRMEHAFQGAFAVVEKEFRDRADGAAYTRALGRRLAFEDLSGTLLVAAHTAVRVQGREQSVVVACQIGDGVVAALDPRGGVVLLGAPDSGAYSGETDFLTSRRQLEPGNLRRKTFAYAGPLRALLVLTDGVSDDYFPPDPGLARLYADLVLNGVLPPALAVGDEAQAELAEHTEPNFNPADGRLDSEAEAVTAEGIKRVMLRSAETYASELGRSVVRIAASPAFLKAGARDAPLLALAPTPADRLRLWLDAYQVRGSFDDRTLVVLHRERTS